MISLSISNIAWGPENDLAVYRAMKDLGFTGLEIAPSRLVGDHPYDNAETARISAEKLRDEYGFSIPSMQSIWYGRPENIFRDARELGRLLSYTVRALDFAKALSCRNLVFGCPKNRNIERSDNDTMKIAREFFTAIGAEADRRGLVIGLEANPEIYHTNFLNRTEDVVEFLRLCRAPGLGLNLDLGTMIYNGESVENVREWVPLISHVHISEPNLAPVLQRPEHERLFRILCEEGYSRYVSVEMGRVQDAKTVTDVMRYIVKVRSKAERRCKNPRA